MEQNSLLVKRKAYANKLSALTRERELKIEEKVKQYRVQLESEPISEEMSRLSEIISALDKVIDYENTDSTKQQTNVATVKSVAVAEQSSRSGMASIDIPTRY